MLSQDLIDSLFPEGLPGPEEWERRYPPRELPPGAEVTRFSPSPTGYLHIGGVYVAIIDADIALHSGGTYLLRIEDTDQARVTEGAVDQFADALTYFSISPQEDDLNGRYGPYVQSSRQEIYLTYVRELLRQGQAYPCFATKAELEDISARQRAAGALPGYYGPWAIWRDAPEEQVRERLAAGDPYVVRFRAPGAASRVSFTDAIRGEITADDNRNDAVILKSSDQPLRLPTYHFAHAVDDHLMRVSLVIRGDEWISSVPLHLQLFDALGFPQVRYAHIAPLMKQDGGSRRKLSKRKDPEASVGFYIEQGYPAEAVQYYLRGLANGQLAEMPLPEALATPISLDDFGAAGPLVDLVKLDDISADYIATLPASVILAQVTTWAQAFDPPLAGVLAAEPDLAAGGAGHRARGRAQPAQGPAPVGRLPPRVRVLLPAALRARDRRGRSAIRRPGARDRSFGGRGLCEPVSAASSGHRMVRSDPRPGRRLGFAPNQKAYKKDPDAYPGSIRDASQIIRVLLTGTTRSPDLAAVAGVLGTDEVLRRARAVLAP